MAAKSLEDRGIFDTIINRINKKRHLLVMKHSLATVPMLPWPHESFMRLPRHNGLVDLRALIRPGG